MVKVKGSALATRMHYLNQKAKPEEKERVLAQLSESCRQAITPNIFVSQWYPYSYFVELTRVIDQVLGNGDLHLAEEIGRYSAEEVIKGIYRIFFQMGSAEYNIKRTPNIWSRYYSAGRLVLTRHSEKSYSMRVEDFDEPTMEHCWSIMGWIYKMLELSGAREIIQTLVKSPAQGQKIYEFLYSWK